MLDDNPAICRSSQALNRSNDIFYFSRQATLSFVLRRFIGLILSMATAILGAISTSKVYLSQLAFILKTRRFIVLVGNLTHGKDACVFVCVGSPLFYLFIYSFV